MEAASPVKSAARVVEAKKVEPQVLAVTGGGLLVISGFLLWHELAVQAEVLMVVAAGVAAVMALMLSRAKVQLVGPATLLGATAAGALWYGINREPLLLLGLGLIFAASLGAAIWDRARPEVESSVGRWHRLLSWQGVALAGLGLSFAVYFHIFDGSDLGFHDFLARRSILSLTWLMAGVALVLFGRSRRANEIRDAGFLVLAAAVGKLVLYDTTHLSGWLRIGTLAAAGVALMGASVVARRLITTERN